jgi:hypothetical protein
MMFPKGKQLWEVAVFLSGVAVLWGSMAVALLMILLGR